MTPVLKNQRRIGWSFLIGWMLLFAAFISGGTIANVALERPLLTQAVADPVAREALMVLWQAVVAALFGAAQWLVLRPYLARAAAWGAAAAVTLWAGSSLILIAFDSGSGQAAGVVAGLLLCGPICAAVQYLLLRRQVARAGWWVLAWPLSLLVLLAVAVAVNAAVQLAFNIDGDSWLALDYGLGSLASGALTGGVLVWLLRQPGQAWRPHPPAQRRTTAEL